MWGGDLWRVFSIVAWGLFSSDMSVCVYIYISFLCPSDGAVNVSSQAKTRAFVSLPLAFNWLMVMVSEHLTVLALSHTDGISQTMFFFSALTASRQAHAHTHSHAMPDMWKYL